MKNYIRKYVYLYLLYCKNCAKIIKFKYFPGAPTLFQSSNSCSEKRNQIETVWDLSGGEFPAIFLPHCEEGGALWKVRIFPAHNGFFIVLLLR